METPTSIPWYRSRVIVGSLLSAGLKVVAALGVTVPVTDEQTQAIATVVALIGSFVGDFVSARARVTQVAAPPVTLRRRD